MIERTYKAREVEGLLDLYFYRRVGFFLARFFARLKMKPAAVSALAGTVGVLAGHLYFYRDLRLNLAGMLLHILANALDNADGQLARLTNRGSRFGRLIDSFADHTVFFSVYLHLVLRVLAGGGSEMIWVLAVAAGMSHNLQSAVADYCRNAYLFFVTGRARAEFDSSTDLQLDYEILRWRSAPFKKLLLRLYLNFTRLQETLLPCLKKLRTTFFHETPETLHERYRATLRPLMPLLGFLMTNIRMFFLFIVLVLDRPALFFWLEVTLLNAVMYYIIRRQENASRSLLDAPAHELALA